MKTILIVEDDVTLCGGVKLYLEKKGYQVLCAHSLHEARRITDKGAETIALMLLDCNLPDGDGMEFCRNWRQRQAVPVIFLTARDTEEDMIRGFRAGADDYMAKPFSVELLSERIAAVLRRSAGEEDRQMFCYRGLAGARSFGTHRSHTGTAFCHCRFRAAKTTQGILYACLFGGLGHGTQFKSLHGRASYCGYSST